MNNTCGSCKFSEPTKRVKSVGEYGYRHYEPGFLCHRFPQVVEKWPNDWCGEFQMNDTLKGVD